MSMHRSFLITSYLMLFLCLLFTHRVVVAQGFTLTQIASDNISLFRSFLQRPTINNAGIVAFQQRVANGDRVIFIGDGVTTTPFFNYTINGFGGSPHIVLNDNGAIGAHTNVLNTSPSVQRIIRINPDATVTTLATTFNTDFTSFDSFVGMNNLGQMAVKAGHTDGAHRILLLDDSGIFEIARSSASLFNLSESSINDAGVVAFSAQEPLLGRSLFTGTVDGPVIKAGTPPPSGFSPRKPLINNSGSVLGTGMSPTVLYTAQADSGNINVDVLFTGFEDPALIGLGTDGSGYSYNNAGNFAAFLGGGGGGGVLVGNDPAQDTVVRLGDMVFGGGVNDIEMGHTSFNDSGQVTFLLQTGTESSSDAVSHVVLATPPVPPPQVNDRIYIADGGAGKIQRLNLDGSGLVDLVTLVSPGSIALDPADRKMYWSGGAASKIQRANLDGSGVEDVVTGVPVSDIALDLVNRKVYWIAASSPPRKIQRSNLDGTGVEDVIILGFLSICALALDVADEKIYLADCGGDRILRTNLDGTGLITLVAGFINANAPREIRLDLVNRKMYWIVVGAGPLTGFRRADFDGTNIEQFLIGNLDPNKLALDISGEKIYWTNGGQQKIRRANLDGLGVEDVITNLNAPNGFPLGIALAPAPNPMADAGGPYTADEGETIMLDASGSSDPDGIVVSFDWDLDNDGQFDDAIGANPEIIFDDDGVFTVAVRVTDNDGLTDTDTAQVTVLNVAPTVDAIVVPVDPVLVDTLVVASATFSDPGILDTHSAVFDWGDGFSTPGLLTPGFVSGDHVYDAIGAYVITLTVIDDDGGAGSLSATVMVITAEEFAENESMEAVDEIVSLPPTSVTTGGNQNALQNFVAQALAALQAVPIDLAEAQNKLQKAIKRTDGCALRGAPDGNGPGKDWITNCSEQVVVYALLTSALNAISP